MSRKGKAPIALPKGVEFKQEGDMLSVKGPKGTLTLRLLPFITLKVEGSTASVSLIRENAGWSKYHGLYWSLINNMVTGTTQGFVKTLDMIGVGYRAAVQGNLLDLQVGNSHPTKLPIPQGIKVTVEKNTKIIVEGIDRQQVGQFAADIRATKPPEPYQGKGIRYSDEYVRRKAGKAAAKK
ncbi:MAG: 50S ribosomal protein L6 [Chlamydiia bacterium]|nr:50S ribosomal protein L6 [Chlamydiia bacterium]